MVLLKRSEYRAALEGLLEFRRSALVQLDEQRLDAPLTNLPYLYEAWGTLNVIAAVLNVATRLGYDVTLERLTSPRTGELWIRVLRDGRPAVVLTHPDGTVAEVIPQRTYSPGGAALRSISFQQRPDVAIEITRHDTTAVWIFDPKYKLNSEQAGEQSKSKPKKVDIDAMHAYRDAIRDSSGHRVVECAAILYPGPNVTYTTSLRAIQADPIDGLSLQHQVEAILTAALAREREAAVTLHSAASR